VVFCSMYSPFKLYSMYSAFMPLAFFCVKVLLEGWSLGLDIEICSQ